MNSNILNVTEQIYLLLCIIQLLEFNKNKKKQSNKKWNKNYRFLLKK